VEPFPDPIAVASVDGRLRAMQGPVTEDQDLRLAQGREHATAVTHADQTVPAVVTVRALARGDEDHLVLGQAPAEGRDKGVVTRITDAEIAGEQDLAQRITSA
jgi:hypothetical protein